MIKKISLTLFVLFSGFLFSAPPAPDPGDGGGSGGVGGVGPGAPGTSPIDMYVYVLVIFAILALMYFGKKFKTQTK